MSRSAVAPVPSRPRLATRSAQLSVESAFAIAARVARRRRAGLPVFDCALGQPADPPSPSVIEAARQALAAGDVRYTHPAGVAPLREAIAADRTARGAPAHADDVLVTPGAKQALLLALLASVEPGADVLLPDPSFQPWHSQVRIAGGTPVPYPLAPPHFRPDADAIASALTPRTRVLLLNAPGNPAGGVACRSALGRIAALAERHDLVIVTDDIYARLAGAGPVPLLAGPRDRVIAVDGFSKAWGMTGFRLGAVIGPPRFREALERLAIASHSCVPGFVQAAGIAALAEPPSLLAARVDTLRRAAAFAAAALDAIPGIRCTVPDGGLYLFPGCAGLLERLGTTDTGLAARLLDEHGVAVIAGSDFGTGGKGHLRISLAADHAALRAAIAALHHLASSVTS